MNTSHPLWRGFFQAWRGHWRLSSRRKEPVWQRLLITALFGLLIGLLMSLAAGGIGGHLGGYTWWRNTLPANLILALSISYCFHLAYAAIEGLLPAERVDRMGSWRDWRAGLLHSGVGLVCVSGGAVIGLFLIDLIWQANALRSVVGDASRLGQFLLVSLLISGGQWFFWKWRWKQQALQLRATEAQLRLLQAQIEPHFLFNTLANVQSLIDHDTPRAKQMLEAFTDYLRASLGQLRHDDSSLGAELEMAQSYLQLIQTRMGERLSFTIAATPEARAAVLAPLLLQPLIENAIQHGLEPKVEGGQVRIEAVVRAGRLEVAIDDDGLGLNAPRRAGRSRSSNGIALANIRSRLQTRYGEQAALTLDPRVPAGTRALLVLPYTAKP